jgi:hypothetical protein
MYHEFMIILFLFMRSSVIFLFSIKYLGKILLFILLSRVLDVLTQTFKKDASPNKLSNKCSRRKPSLLLHVVSLARTCARLVSLRGQLLKPLYFVCAGM